MAELKTQLTKQNAMAFLADTTEGQQLDDCKALVRIMKKAAGAPPRMWGSNIVGFGSYTYQYASGKTGDWPLIAFAPRKGHVTVYLMADKAKTAPLLERLGKHKLSGGCLHIKRLSDVDLGVLDKLVSMSAKAARKPGKVSA